MILEAKSNSTPLPLRVELHAREDLRIASFSRLQSKAALWSIRQSKKHLVDTFEKSLIHSTHTHVKDMIPRKRVTLQHMHMTSIFVSCGKLFYDLMQTDGM